MSDASLSGPLTDPTSIFENFRGSYGTEVLTAAVAEFDLFRRLAEAPATLAELGRALELEERPTIVLVTALRAMGLLECGADNRLSLADLAREHLIPSGEFYVGDYLGLAAQSPGVREMIARLRTNRPAGAEQAAGAAFIYREGLESAMERELSARHLTLSLAGRAKNVAPLLARNYPLTDAGHLLDVGGGSGIYSIAYLLSCPQLRATVFDRPEVLKVAEEFAKQYGVADRLELAAGDMFADPLPPGADVCLLSNILHDWDVPECQQLIGTCAGTLPSNGKLLIHDVFLSDALDGPLPIALYSASLFSLTEGRAYSAQEYRTWLEAAGFHTEKIVPTRVHCGVLPGVKTG